MKRQLVIVGTTCMVLICAVLMVRAELDHHRAWRSERQRTRIRAEQGDARSLWRRAPVYYYGKGVSRDVDEAVRWYRKSAEQGYPQAQYHFGVMYYYG